MIRFFRKANKDSENTDKQSNNNALDAEANANCEQIAAVINNETDDIVTDNSNKETASNDIACDQADSLHTNATNKENIKIGSDNSRCDDGDRLQHTETTIGGGSSSWLQRLKTGLSKSAQNINHGINNIIHKRKLDSECLQELEELLIMADMGADTASYIIQKIANNRYNKEISAQELKQVLAAEIADILQNISRPLQHNGQSNPHVVLVVGVNGNGKTTSIGKLTKQFLLNNQTVMLCAADTFRAAAVEQLQIWGQRNQVPVITAANNADAASVAYKALEAAKSNNINWLLIDTAGRLHNKANLMAELQKIVKVLQKQDPTAPHTILQILDATTGQNAINQVQTFKELIGVNGLIVTKLDGSAKAGVVVALARKFALPIHAIGVGESIDDLKPFTASNFANCLVGLE